jgi:hypothetical protein
VAGRTGLSGKVGRNGLRIARIHTTGRIPKIDREVAIAIFAPKDTNGTIGIFVLIGRCETNLTTGRFVAEHPTTLTIKIGTTVTIATMLRTVIIQRFVKILRILTTVITALIVRIGRSETFRLNPTTDFFATIVTVGVTVIKVRHGTIQLSVRTEKKRWTVAGGRTI